MKTMGITYDELIRISEIIKTSVVQIRNFMDNNSATDVYILEQVAANFVDIIVKVKPSDCDAEYLYLISDRFMYMKNRRLESIVNENIPGAIIHQFSHCDPLALTYELSYILHKYISENDKKDTINYQNNDPKHSCYPTTNNEFIITTTNDDVTIFVNEYNATEPSTKLRYEHFIDNKFYEIILDHNDILWEYTPARLNIATRGYIDGSTIALFKTKECIPIDRWFIEPALDVIVEKFNLPPGKYNVVNGLRWDILQDQEFLVPTESYISMEVFDKKRLYSIVME